MARRRYQSTEISIDKKCNDLVNKYGYFAGLLYDRMIPHAEDDCTITGDPYEIKMKVVPGFSETTEDDIQKAIGGMVEIGLLFWLDKKTLCFPSNSFYKYQSYIPENKRVYRDQRRKSPKNAEEQRETPLTYPNLTKPIERDIRAREETEIDKAVREINDKSFEFKMNGVSPEFQEDTEMRLKDGFEVELIIKALSIGATNSTGNSAAKCKYAISVLQGWAAEGIKTVEQWNKKNKPPPGSTRADKKQDAVDRAKEIALKRLRDKGVITDDTS
jgi:DnaD/phage-associated family protein